MDTKEIIISVEAWGEEAAKYMAKIDAAATVEDYAQQWEDGAELYKVSEKGKTIGYFMTRLDSDAQGLEGVIVAGAGDADFDLTDVIVPYVEQRFKNLGCYSSRIHTSRVGLVKKLSSQGYGAAELVLRKKL
jgi:predicted hydrolase (HD superfamily)